jgi:hypothetical protein
MEFNPLVLPTVDRVQHQRLSPNHFSIVSAPSGELLTLTEKNHLVILAGYFRRQTKALSKSLARFSAWPDIPHLRVHSSDSSEFEAETLRKFRSIQRLAALELLRKRRQVFNLVVSLLRVDARRLGSCVVVSGTLLHP